MYLGKNQLTDTWHGRTDSSYTDIQTGAALGR